MAFPCARERDSGKIAFALLDTLPDPYGTHFWTSKRLSGTLLGESWASLGCSWEVPGYPLRILVPSQGDLMSVLLRFGVLRGAPGRSRDRPGTHFVSILEAFGEESWQILAKNIG